jgi:hypothetical protein
MCTHTHTHIYIYIYTHIYIHVRTRGQCDFVFIYFLHFESEPLFFEKKGKCRRIGGRQKKEWLMEDRKQEENEGRKENTKNIKYGM